MSKSVCQFLLGIDLTSLPLGDDDCSVAFCNMSRLEWLKLINTGLDRIPRGIEKLSKLQRLFISKNKIQSLEGHWYDDLTSLRVIMARKNELISAKIPNDFFRVPLNLQVVDLSYNHLTEVPAGLLNAVSILILNLSNNRITTVPKELFANCASLMMIDLSDNQINAFPTNLRRMPNLQTLNLSNNPLSLAQLRSVCGLKKLCNLFLSNTERRLENFPPDLDKLENLTELDISENLLQKVPQTIYEIKSLVKLNISGNEIDEISSMIECWPLLEVLNLSRNKLGCLPSFITRLTKLKKLYVDSNKLTFNGIPAGIGKLINLQVFSAADNELENIPEGLCRCGQLRYLNLRDNKLVTLPDAIHVVVEGLTHFNIYNNPNLKMPPKYDDTSNKPNYTFYNIDFSLETQILVAKGVTAKKPLDSTPQKDTASRIKRLRRKKSETLEEEEGNDSKCVLEGMKKVAKDKDALLEEKEKENQQSVSSKRWQQNLERPNLDYSKLFEDDVGMFEGLEIWDIDDFYPRKISDEVMKGIFYKGDCYIILQTSIDDKSHSLTWSIYYWIGSESTLDKVTCSAMHSVNLRNFIGAECRCEREDEGDESEEFLSLFDGEIQVMEGAMGETGFVKFEEKKHRKKLYRLFGELKSISVYACDPSPLSLDTKFAYLFDESYDRLFVWLGRKSNLIIQKKARLLADKISQKERKGCAELLIEYEGNESIEFRTTLANCSESELGDWSSRLPDDMSWIAENWRPPSPVLFEVELGKGSLEMPQIELPNRKLSKSVLQKKHVYIINSNGEVFVWIGDMASKFLKFAAMRLAYELTEMLPFGSRRSPTVCFQQGESHIFKMQFIDWEDTLAVDFTRSAESVRKRGVDLKEIMEKDKLQINMRSFFLSREKPVPWEEAVAMMEEYNEDLVIKEDDTSIDNKYRIKQFVYQKGIWVPVENRWVGHFFNQDSYVIHTEYWEYPEVDEEENEDEQEEDDQPKIQTVVYFWQGREASQIPWLQFNFSVWKEQENKGRKIEIKMMHQQQEILQFLAHFKFQFVIHSGKYSDRNSDKRKSRVELFYMRDNGNPLCVRTIEVPPIMNFLNSCFHYILKVPAKRAQSEKDKIFCWLGSKSNKNYDEIIQIIAKELFAYENFGEEADICLIEEGNEPPGFWNVLIGKTKTYDREADFINYSRLFRLSNDQGYFSASEKCSDFCQDDLADEDAMLLDTGKEIYVWYGSKTSEIEKKLSLKAAKLYKEHIMRLQPQKNRELKLTKKNSEPYNFIRCFHGWGPFREPKDWSG